MAKQAAARRQPPPTSVQVSFLMWVGVALLTALLVIVAFLAGPTPGSGAVLPEQPPDAGYVIGAVFALVVFLIVPIVAVVIAWKMRVGRNWARMTLAVAGAIALVVVVLNIASTLGGPTGLDEYAVFRLMVAAGQLVLLAGAVALMLRPADRDWFS